MTEEELKAQEAANAAGNGNGEPNPNPNPAPEPPTGRAAMLASYRGANPDAGDDVDDESLWGYANNALSERDKYAESNKKYQDRDKVWMDLYERDPRWGMASAITEETGDFFYALGRAFPDFNLDMSDEDREGFLRGRQEEMKRLEDHRAKLTGLKDRFKERCTALEMPEETAEIANQAFVDFVNSALDGDIPDEMIDSFLKGVDYDASNEANLEAARQEGKREAIDRLKGRRRPATELPDMGGGKSANKGGGSVSFEEETPRKKSLTEMVAEDDEE